MKNLILSLILSLFFLGCSEKTEENKSTETIKEQDVRSIEIVENENFRDSKLQELQSKGIATGAKGDSFYYDYDKKKKPSKEEKTYTPLDANMRVRSPYEKVEISLLVSKLSKDFIIKCSACHNDYANGIIGPSLLDKDKDFIFDTIHAYKTKKKENALMNELVHMMSDKEIDKISTEIAEFNKKIKKLREKR